MSVRYYVPPPASELDEQSIKNGAIFGFCGLIYRVAMDCTDESDTKTVLQVWDGVDTWNTISQMDK